MGEIVKRIEDNMKDTPNRRIGDVNILYLANVVEDLKKKLEDGISDKVEKIWAKLNALPCDVHTELIKKVEEITMLRLQVAEQEPKSNRRMINWLWGAYLSTILGIVYIIIKVR